ncbi:nitrate- and nitrite sensing domain-containing protein [Asanoa sp. WMMD1127]|uniref:sensor histidine kinase n=1 Tax=Asanoa sp. WMMD1127 TaxID=3016107 RepID=UPI0024165752|nr:nitrate- and nitrite sensing domain-containing protein [Asanoa sp. WMMD1127]MDG4826655.1 nitrate- and nitrite sensing domain-containing protein [Asanoa sp. WMMD1127]
MAGATGKPQGAVPQHRRQGDAGLAPHRRRSRFRLRDWRIRSKLIAVLIVPSLAFVLLAGFQARTLFTQADTLGQFSAEVGVADEIGALVDAVQQERDRTAGELAAPSDLTGQPNLARLTNVLRPYEDAVDAAATRFRAAADPARSGDVSWQVSYDRTIELIDQLPTLRTAAGGSATPQTVFDSYNRLVDALLALLAEPSPGADHPELSQAVLRTVQIARVKELGSRARARIFAASMAGGYGPDDLVVLSDLRTQQLAALADFRVTATPGQVTMYDDMSALPGFVEATRLEEQTIGTARAPQVLGAEEWWAASQNRLQELRRVEERVSGDAARAADERSTAQLRDSLLVAGGILLVLLIAVLASVVVGRSIARSLRTLRTHALQVAQVQLPDALERLRAMGGAVPRIDVWPAAVRSADEIGEVAEAFVAVHHSAIAVGVEQANMRRTVNAMFVNLARRSQVLVERQLELLDELEREESDPDQLDNLFKLDHLAARMRRNDDSLLVLAGIESPRRWSDPVALPAVVLAAVAEIEFYPRVRHDAIDPVHVVGHAVGDVVHLLAELLENATVFSPPSTAVHVFAHGGSRVGTVIEIADDGLGMSESALREANDTLAAPPTADVAASERMGLFVVSHLAARHGIRVELRAGRSGGVIALVRLPADILVHEHAELPYRPTRPMLAAVAAVSGAAPSLQPAPRAGGPVPGGPVPALTLATPGGGVPAVAAPAIPLPIDPAPAGGGFFGAPEVPAPAAQPVPTAGPTAPVARRPGRTTSPRRASAAAPAAAEGVSWFSRASGSAAESVPAPAAEAPAAPPATGGVGPTGLPMRVPMAQLPGGNGAAPVPAPRGEADPEAVSSLLNQFYGGVRRAEAEDPNDLTSAPAWRGEREQR